MAIDDGFTGVNALDGKALSGTAHLHQSIRDILTTRVGTRCMRRQYGSRLPDLIDKPMSEGLVLEICAESGYALAKWEPRFTLTRMEVLDASEDGRIVLALEGRVLVSGDTIRLEGIEIT